MEASGSRYGRWRGHAVDAARGALVGVIIGLATSAIVRPAFDCRRSDFGCVPVAFATIAIVLVVALLLGWLAYRLLKADLPGLLAVAGVGATLLIVVVVGGDAASEPFAMALQGAGGYVFSAVGLSPRSPRVLRFLAGGVLAIGLLALLYVI